MNNNLGMKEHILAALRGEFDRWQELLASMSEEEITARQLPSDLSIKDVVAHLREWQRRTVARVEAARFNREPLYPEWPTGPSPDSEAATEQTNAWIHATYLHSPWSEVYKNWSEGFENLLKLSQGLSEEDMLEKDYPWLKGYPLYMILVSTYSHHHIEHYPNLVAWLKDHGKVSV